MSRPLLLTLLLATGCPSPPPDTPAAPPDRLAAPAWGSWAGPVRVHVLDARFAEPPPPAPPVVGVDVAPEEAAPTPPASTRLVVRVDVAAPGWELYDGMRVWRRGQLLYREGITLETPGGPLAPVNDAAELPDRIVLPDRPDPLLLTLRFDAPRDLREAVLVVRHRDGGEARLPLGDATVEATFDPTGRPVADGATQGAAGFATQGAARATVAKPPPVLPAPAPADAAPADALRAHLATALPPPVVPNPRDPLHALAARFRTPEEAAAWVSEEIGVLATVGIQRGPEAVLRAGAGSPPERAELLRALLLLAGHDALLACGDLDPASLRAADALPPGPADALTAQLRDEAAELAPRIRDALLAEPLATLPPARRAEVPLWPQWCWVQVVPPEGGLVDLDLRPPDAGDAAPPFSWTNTAQTDRELWRLAVSVLAILDTPSGTTTQELYVWPGDVPAFASRALLLDLRQTDDGLRPTLLLLDDDDAAGRAGGLIRRGELARLLVRVSWTDPSGAREPLDEAVLWERGQDGAEPGPLRVLIGGDPQDPTGDLLAARAHAALVPGTHPWPDGALLLAHHTLRTTLRARVAPLPSDPVVDVTVLAGGGGGGLAVRHLTLGGGAPPLDPTPAGVARRAAAEEVIAVALGRDHHLGRDPASPLQPAPAAALPTVWAPTPANIGQVPGIGGTSSVAPALAYDLGKAIGGSENGTLWTWDPRAAVLTRLPLVTPRAPAPPVRWAPTEREAVTAWSEALLCTLGPAVVRGAGGALPDDALDAWCPR